MNSDTPTVDEIFDCYNDKCAEQTCENCKLSLGSTSDSTNECAIRYTVAVLTGEMELGDSFLKEEPTPESNLPAWCKIGAWVAADYPSRNLGMIDKDLGDGRVNVKWFHNVDGCTGSDVYARYLKPVRFRPYTYEEAKKLVGKIMEYTNTDTKDRRCHLITSAIGWTHDDGRTGVIFNHEPWFLLQKYKATIDGIPVGVPEIDEAALKGKGE